MPAIKPPGFGHSQVQGVIRQPGELPVSRHRHQNIGGFQGNLEIKEAPVLKLPDPAQGAGRQGRGRGRPVFFQEVRLQRAGVHPQAQGHAPLPAGLQHLAGLLFAPEVAGVDADGVGPLFQGGQGQAVVEVDVGDEGQGALWLDLPEGRGRLLVRHGQPGHFAAGRGQPLDLGQGGRHVPGVGVGHALHHHRGAAADLHRADVNGPGGPARDLEGIILLRHNLSRF